jgi:2-polyprenyl-3-methyl-5-hydroxy-6-metoxy-1,4-benzoquinol methylase
MKESQKEQESYYWFPYHYVTQFTAGFTQTFHDTWGINYAATLEFILQQVAAERLSSIVDIGCGDGRLTRELTERFPNLKIVGVDYSARAINLAKAMSPGIPFLNVDITQGGWDETFDLAILMEVFEHVPPAVSEAFVGAVSRLLRPNGLIYVTVPHVNKPLEKAHFRHFSMNSLTSCFDGRFEVLQMLPFERRSNHKLILDKILGNRYCILNHAGLKNRIYSYYKRHLFTASSEAHCQRIFMKARLRT